ncbi:MAG: MoxR family ATPase [Gemmatimonadetes bacterium]|nr:MoxR family ATPase [Gemmatimonadota bacterium]
MNPTSSPPAPAATGVARDRDVHLLQRAGAIADELRSQVERRIVGQQHIVDSLVTAMIANGHVLLVGVPGLAKTLIISTLAEALHLKFNRIQFTPDLMPTDITGTEVIQEDKVTGERIFRFVRGPIFANIVLADEINRTPPKTQAALLEAMQERDVTAAGHTYHLDPPFFVLATQNPIEQEGTYPLPEAQLDRFMFDLRIGYPSREEEEKIATLTQEVQDVPIKPVVHGNEIIELQHLVRRIPVPPSIVGFAVRLARSTRPGGDEQAKVAKRYISWGAGPRASQYLVLGAKARAAFRGVPMPTMDDVLDIAPSILAHRIVVNFDGEAEGLSTRDVVRELLTESKKWI